MSEDNINNGLCTQRIFSKWNLLVSACVHVITLCVVRLEAKQMASKVLRFMYILCTLVVISLSV